MPVLSELLEMTKDGEWGKGEEFPDSSLMSVIRGTDFEAVRIGQAGSVRERYIANQIATRKRLRAWDIILETAGGSRDRPTGRSVILKPGEIDVSEAPSAAEVAAA